MRRDDGMALPAALMIMLIVLLLGGVALASTVHSVDRSISDRRMTRAVAAANAGIDVATWRMNKVVASAPVTGLLGLASGVAETLSCVSVDALGALRVEQLGGPGWCPATPWEAADPQARYRYFVANGVHVTGEAGRLLERRVVAEGEVQGRRRRLLAVLRIELDPANALSLFRVVRLAECRSGSFSASAPDEGCPRL